MVYPPPPMKRESMPGFWWAMVGGDVAEDFFVGVVEEEGVFDVDVAVEEGVEVEYSDFAVGYVAGADFYAVVVAFADAVGFEAVGPNAGGEDGDGDEAEGGAGFPGAGEVAEYDGHGEEDEGDDEDDEACSEKLDEDEAGEEGAEDASGGGDGVYLADDVACLVEVGEAEFDDDGGDHSEYDGGYDE